MKLSSFLKECSEKGVLKKLSIYIVSSWVLIQVLAVLYQPLGLPQVSVTYLILLLLVGLPVNLLIIWRTVLAPLEKQQLTPKGKKKKKPSAFQRMYFSSALLVSLLSAVAFGLIVKSAFKRSADLRELSASDKIGILKFGNNTGEEDMDIVGKMSADWIMHGITENKLAQVVSPEIVNDYIDILKSTDQAMDNESVLKDYFKPAKVISGNYFLKGDKLIFQSSITDSNIEKTLISFQPVECDKASPLDCIETLKQRVLGYLITAEREDLNLQDFPPKYNAYRYFLEAMADLGILSKKETIERKRPYFRYSLEKQKITFEIDLLKELEVLGEDGLEHSKIREKKNAGVRFSLARNGQYFSNVAIWVGKGRQRSEKKINLTTAQGKFLYNLPFPDGEHLSLEEIRVKAGIEPEHMPEIRDLVEELIQYKVIEVLNNE